jgi:hypothetical protein
MPATLDGSGSLLVRDTAEDVPNASIHVTIGSGQTVPTTGIKGYMEVPFNARVVRWTLIGDASGSAQIDIWKDTWANFPPTNADSIVGAGTEPYLSSEQARQDTTPDWDQLTLNEGDVLVFNLDSVTTCKQLDLDIKVERT